MRGAALYAVACVFWPLMAGAQSVQVLRVPDGGIQPQVACDAQGNIHLVYFKGPDRGGDLFYIRSGDGGRTWTKPIPVNHQSGSAVITGTIRGARMALGKNARVHVAWMGSSTAQPQIKNHERPMLYARLNDWGDGFEAEKNVIAAHPGLDGGGTVAADDAGHVYVIWHAPGDLDQSEASRRVWIARSDDDGVTFAPEVDGGTTPHGACACCNLAAIAAPPGLLVLYRTATEMVHRDMHALTFDLPKGLKCTYDEQLDDWKIGKCVMSTAMLVRSGDRVFAAWECRDQVHWGECRLTGDADIIRDLHEAPGAAGDRKYPAIAANARGEVLMAWSKGAGWSKGGALEWQAWDSGGKPAGSIGHADDLPLWGMPAVVARPDGGFLVIY